MDSSAAHCEASPTPLATALRTGASAQPTVRQTIAADEFRRSAGHLDRLLHPSVTEQPRRPSRPGCSSRRGAAAPDPRATPGRALRSLSHRHLCSRAGSLGIRGKRASGWRSLLRLRRLWGARAQWRRSSRAASRRTGSVARRALGRRCDRAGQPAPERSKRSSASALNRKPRTRRRSPIQSPVSGGLAADAIRRVPAFRAMASDGGDVFRFVPVARDGDIFEKHVAIPTRLDSINAVGRHGFGHELGTTVPERDVLVRDRRPTDPDHRGPDRPHRDLALHPAGRGRPGSSRTAGGGEYGWQAVPPAARSLHYRPSHARSFDARREMDRHRRGTPRPSAR